MTTTRFLPCLVAAGTMLAGCGREPSRSGRSADTSRTSAAGHITHHGDHHEQSHPELGPHGGSLVELGQGIYHAELVHESQSSTLSIYILDHTARQELAIAAAEVVVNVLVNDTPLQFKLAAVPTASGKTGAASHFALADRRLIDILHDGAWHDAPKLRVMINGKSYIGTIYAHDHHDVHDDHFHRQARRASNSTS